MRNTATLRKDRHSSGIDGSMLYWSLINGDFPACLDDSEESLCSSDLAESFDLIVVLNLPQKRTNRTQKLYRLDWIEYAEVFLKAGGAMAICAEATLSNELICSLQNAGLCAHRYSLGGSIDLVLAVKSAAMPEVQINSSRIVESLVESLTKPGMMVLEPFATDGRLLAYCQQTERYCLGIASRKSDFRQIESFLKYPHQRAHRKTTLKLLRNDLTAV